MSKHHYSKINKTLQAAKELGHDIEDLTEEVHRRNSPVRTFFLGIISGFGHMIGATLVFAIVLTVISYFIKTSDAVWVHQFIEFLGIQEYFA